MRLRWKRRALNQFIAIRHFIATRNPLAARSLGADIENAAIRLKQFPWLGHPGERVGIFALHIPGIPNVLPYRIVGDAIAILAVFDRRRNPEDTL